MLGDIIVGVDIGATKVCTVISKMKKNNQLEILGCGTSKCSGFKRGLAVDLDNVSRAIKESVTIAEKASGIRVVAVTVAISGFHVILVPSVAKISFESNIKEISETDVTRLLKEAKNFEIPYDRQVVDVIPQQYIIDGYDEIVDPIGMMGAVLEVEANVVLGSTIATQGLLKSVEKAGYQVSGIVIEGLANSEIAMSEEEKKLGVILVDVGGDKTDITYFQDGRIVYYDSIPIGGEHITNDIVIGLKVSYNDADRFKKQFPLSQKDLINNDQNITINTIGENTKTTVKISDIINIIEARTTELFSILADKLSGITEEGGVATGIVLAGQGVYHLAGVEALATKLLKMPVRNISSKLPGDLRFPYMTALGIVKYVAGISMGKHEIEILSKEKFLEEKGSIEEKMVNKFINFFKR